MKLGRGLRRAEAGEYSVRMVRPAWLRSVSGDESGVARCFAQDGQGHATGEVTGSAFFTSCKVQVRNAKGQQV